MLRWLIFDKEGTETVEWGLIAGLIVGGSVLTIIPIGAWVQGRFTQLDNDLQASNPAP